jgi:hypothetical protein
MARNVALSLICTLALHAVAVHGVPLPSGATNHGDPHLLCTPTTLRDVALFFLANYGAHALTTISDPGQQLSATVQSTILALLFPVSGATRGFYTIIRGARWEKDELRMAAKAGALYTVVKRRGFVQNPFVHR